MINEMNMHYAFTNPATVHDEEALTTLELAGRQGAKINEVIRDQNALRSETKNHLLEQDKSIEHIRKVVVPEEVDKEVNVHINNGHFDTQIDKYLGGLSALLVTPELFGAKGDGVTDDTEAVLSALNKCYGNGATLQLMTGRTYLVGDIEITQSVTIDFNGGALKRKAETVSNYYVLKVSADNVVLNNPHLIGDRNEHVGDSGEWGHCLYIGANNVTVNNGLYEYAWGDGVYIYDGVNVHLNGIQRAYKCSRNGVSVVKGSFINIDTLLAEYIDRTDPMSAIDIEGNDNDDFTTNIHIGNIISRYNSRAFSLVCRGNLVKDVSVSHIEAVGTVGSPLAISYSENGDNATTDINEGSFVQIGSVMIDKCSGNAVRFTRWNRPRCPYVNIDKVRVTNFVNGSATIDTALVGLLLERDYDHITNYGGFSIDIDAEHFNESKSLMLINNQQASYKAISVATDIVFKSSTRGLLNPTFSFTNIGDVKMYVDNFNNDQTNVMNGFNYITVNKPNFRTWLREFVMYIGVNYVDLELHNTMTGKIYVNDVEYAGERLYNMKHKLVYGFRVGNDIRLYFDQTSRVWATTNSTSQKTPENGQCIFASEEMKPAWYYEGKWYFADGTEYVL